MFENYAFAISLLSFAWLVGHTLNHLLEGVCENSVSANLKKIDASFQPNDSSSVIPSAVQKT